MKAASVHSTRCVVSNIRTLAVAGYGLYLTSISLAGTLLPPRFVSVAVPLVDDKAKLVSVDPSPHVSPATASGASRMPWRRPDARLVAIAGPVLTA